MTIINKLAPSLIWHFFDEILKIPRPSKKESMILAFIEKFATDHKLHYRKDAIGNILIVKPATEGYENRKKVILQCHVDMVCEKNESSSHNFEKDPINAFIDNGWIKAKGTTLGADNGIGIAAQLAVLSENNLKHGPLECLFTVDEETGLTGAFNLDAAFIDSDILINLDSEDEGELFIGCAGGANTVIQFDVNTSELNALYTGFAIEAKGLTGGHSGDDINKGLGNSIKIISRLLYNAGKKFDIRLNHLSGGNLHNAIPREAIAKIAVRSNQVEMFAEFMKRSTLEIKNELKITEPNLSVSYTAIPVPVSVFEKNYQKQLIYALHACPNGVIAMSREMPGIVETSTNLASIKFIGENKIEIMTSQRSSIESAKKDIAGRIESLFKLTKAEVSVTDTYPGWTPNTDSEIVKITSSCYRQLFGSSPNVRSIHAGLECGLFLKKNPKLDMVSFGPTIKGAHSPDERMEISTVKKFWDLLVKVLEEVPEK